MRLFVSCPHKKLSAVVWTVPHCAKEWRGFPRHAICDDPLSRSTRRSFAPLQKPPLKNCSHGYTEALSDTAYVLAQELSGLE